MSISIGALESLYAQAAVALKGNYLLQYEAAQILAHLEQQQIGPVVADTLLHLRTTEGDFVTLDHLTSASLGNLKHYVRGRLHFFGFVVDVAWADSPFMAAITPIVAAACASALAAAGLTPQTPAAPPTPSWAASLAPVAAAAEESTESPAVEAAEPAEPIV